MTPAPVTFETWVNAALEPTFNANPGTNQTSVSGTYSNFNSETYSYTSYGKQAYDSTGGYTGIVTFGEPIIETQNDPNFLIAADNWVWGYPDIIGRTVQSNFVGTSETIVRFEALYGEGDDIPSLTRFGTTISESLASEPQTTASFLQWSTTNTASSVITTQSTQTQETFWTYSETQNTSETEWVTTDRTASTQGTTRTNGSKQEITVSGTSTTFGSEDARSTKKITRSTATYNTVILTTANRPNALETVESVDPQKQSGTSTFYGELSYNQPPTLSSFAGGLILSGGEVGYTTNLVATTTSGSLFWTRTGTSNRASAGITIDGNPPRAVVGQVISTVSPLSTPQQVATTVNATVLTNGLVATTLASFVTMALGPAQTTRSFAYVTDVDTAVEAPAGEFGGVPAGFSVSSEGPITMRIGFDDVTANASVESRADGMTISPQVGFTSSIAALQTSRINTLKFAVVGQGGNSGTSYQNGNEFNLITAKSFFFAPKSAQEFLPITGSASSSNTSRSFSMRYSGATQSRSSTIGTGTDATITSVTSAWSAAGAAQTFWVNVSRGRVEGSPAFPTIPALIIGGEGQALITRGLYETYSGSGTATSSGTNNFVEVNSVSSFSGGDGVTAIKPLQYYVPITGSNAQTTSASFANNLTAQPLDD
jgi:hypothetical protein